MAKNRLAVCTAFAAGLCILFGLLLPGTAPMARLANAAFYAGMPLLLFALCQAVLKWGSLGLFAFSFRRMRHVIKVSKGEEQPGDSDIQETYYDYTSQQSKARRIFLEPLLVGGGMVLLSLVLSLAA